MRISIAQMEPVLGDLKANIEYICNTLAEESTRSSQLVLFPELSISGYVQSHELLDKVAITEYSRTLAQIKKTCSDYKIETMISFPEVDEHQFYITAMYIDENGEVLGKYRKTHLFANEQELFTRGKDFPILKTQFGYIGMMICYDLEFPEVARLLKLKGAEIILISTANMTPYEKHQNVYIASRALENELPIAIANQYGMNDPHQFFGHSAVVDHNGNFQLYIEKGVSTKYVDISMQIERDPQLEYTKQILPTIYHQLSHAMGEDE
ncbi:carbon-nitrogen hydrolase family protein [Staphylococcus succinus]|uniref:carbon-nitrogen hydrolase family protein n=1 Tax=Staphylococcus succinus TaxID=61015 RepID=UPI003F5C470E